MLMIKIIKKKINMSDELKIKIDCTCKLTHQLACVKDFTTLNPKSININFIKVIAIKNKL